MRPLILRRVECRGREHKSPSSSRLSCCMYCMNCRFIIGLSQKLPTKTRRLSGESITRPRLHMRAPYTRMSCLDVIWSALFNTTLTLFWWPLRDCITDFISSDMSSLCASNNTKILSQRLANHLVILAMLYPRLTTCFAPASTPGVSIRLIFFNIGAFISTHSNLFRKSTPYFSNPENGLSLATTAALPGITLSCSECITAMKRSVVGSGPTRSPRCSLPRR
mmetsp:Transcript_22610/g.44056  ORF Transcript_22610/g.44056 Transcript_22610/m.44056 type:complete len:222 (+) Transcript_22610:1127-1792(+)